MPILQCAQSVDTYAQIFVQFAPFIGLQQVSTRLTLHKIIPLLLVGDFLDSYRHGNLHTLQKFPLEQAIDAYIMKLAKARNGLAQRALVLKACFFVSPPAAD